MQKKILVTGAAGFIGFHLSQKLCANNWDVFGLDNLNNYYDLSLKEDRLNLLLPQNNFKFFKIDLVEKESIKKLFEEEKFDYVVNLAAQAGVRYSLENPYAYVDSNLSGFLNILEGCRHNPVKHLVYASSSSVYGANTKMPFSVHDNVDHPVSLYAATKKANELMAHTYSNLYKIPTTGLRFFTVYGPWGRPDMALFIFTKKIAEGKPIDVYNNGKMKRDFTYIDDIVDGIFKLIPSIPEPNPNWNGNDPDSATSFAPYKLFNIGNNQPVELLRFIEVIEDKLGKKAIKNFMPIQPGDVPATYADVDDLINAVGFKPNTLIEDGVAKFVEWYKDYYKIGKN
ncbi:MAG: capsular biosynthesis protein CpsI [Ignavibacteria bacterium RIFOXYB2_FULL_35_12]|nr:MAG: capsular biosynthesis protein CpsI [Ignavibacteria bacterium GWA2_36_19]OGU55782.1 MAG: capsular biosynthesis protein CpsI [Ignavibacteria bacterium GWF2_35_20]OGU97033.1 MAG: capsular biosynthesis protein CpsI [Ignavibacteria bacterium RIFOXYB12_FULL_35_14]OGV03498.1 MAG: capsular biosynthesis protein CpsI [Ignavibacteria bacterium RIFOXYB2_FULL_35_12]OGV31205.1 MAG: capsular biosynthesis protein CpsI [Ignavibacteria bacterium RIFOXYD12_FULL_36_8]